MLAFPCAEMVSLQMATASNQAERSYTRTNVSGTEKSEVKKSWPFKFETGISRIKVSIA
jgi:hypothetical protein